MKKIITLLCLSAILSLSSGAQTPIKIVDVNLKGVSLDSIQKLLIIDGRYNFYYVLDKGDDSLKVDFISNGIDLPADLTKTLKPLGYTLSQINNSLFALKGVGIVSELPEGYFLEKRDAETLTNYLKVLSNEETTAKSQNKIYKIGDPNRPKTGGKAILTGYVKNNETGEPIPGITVMIEKPSTVVTTDAYGYYRISMPSGQQNLIVKGYGMEDTNLSLDVYGDGELEVPMKEKVYPLKGIILTAESTQKLRSAQMGLERIRIDRIKHVPAAFGEADVLKIVLILPGVKSVGESSGGFNVRGGATDQNLILFNDGTIYNPTHLFGLFSAFNPDVVSDIELYKSSIPAKFGGRISSVLEINSRNGNNNKITGSAGLGLLTSKFHLEGPIWKGRTNFIAGLRTTYSNWILKLLPEDSGYKNGTASFNDFTFGLNHKINSKNTIYLYGYYAGDGFSFSTDTSYAYNSMNASLKWRSTFNDKHNFTFSTGYDRYKYNTKEKGNVANAFDMSFMIEQMFLKTNFNWLLNDKHSINYGINATLYNLNPGTMLPIGDSSLVLPKILQNERAIEAALYLGDTWNISDRVSLDIGFRYGFYSALGPKIYNTYSSEDMTSENITGSVNVGQGEMVKLFQAPEIRISGRVSLSDNVSFKAGFNSMTQNIHMLSNTASVSPTDTWKLSDANITPQKGWQAAFGLYNNAMGKKVELSMEGYYKEMYDYLDYKGGAVLVMNEFIERDVIKTQGKAYGIELMAKKPLGKLNGWISYTYSRTFLKESGVKEQYHINDGNWYPAAYDRPNDFKIIGNYKFTQRVSLSLNVDYSSGRPVTIPISRYYYGDGYRLFYSDRNAYRIPDYFRMDLAINIEPSHYLKYWTYSTITFGIYNITGRKNAFSVFYDTSGGTGIQGYQLSIFGAPIPYINYNIKF